jgi:GH18 family chitinase
VDDFDAALAHAAFVTHRDATIAGLVALAEDGGYDGVNVDFENLAFSRDIADDRAAFTVFIHELAARLHALSLKLAISVPGKTEDSIDDDWSYPFDYAALGEDADVLQLMTYDEHGPWSEPGPVSGADWVEDCVAYAVSLVEPAKLLIGLPAYGYDWDLADAANNTSFSWKDVPVLVAQSEIMGNQPFPYLLHRAHEVAVVTLDDQEQLERMIDIEMRNQGVEMGEVSHKQCAKDQSSSTKKRYGK